MSIRCGHGFDADHVARALTGTLEDERVPAFDAHLPACAACRRAAATFTRARGTWRRALDHDDTFGMGAREQRLTSAEGIPRVRGGRLGVLLLGTATGALAVSGWLAAGRPSLAPRDTALPSDAVSVATAPTSPPSAASGLPSAAAPLAGPPTGPATARSSPATARETLIASRACPACSVAAGSEIASDAEVAVARGSTLVLSWSLRDGTSDTVSSVDVDGPAAVRAVAAAEGEGGAPPALLLSRGVARAEAGAPRELRTDLARTRGDHAAWRVDARSDRTRVEALAGEVRVEALVDAGVAITLHAGDSIDVLRDGRALPVRHVASPAAPRAMPAPDPWEASEAALRDGDRAAAEAALRTLVAAHTGADVHARATLRLAELELARGDRTAARARLEGAMHADERAVAADAAFLLARSASSPRERADVWRDYLATSPPSPYREQASIERAGALIDVGDREGARALVTALHAAGDLPEVVRAALGRLDERLRAHTAP